MACKLAIIGVLCLVYCTGSVYATLGAGCSGTAGTVGNCTGANHEVCNAALVCVCDAANYYAPQTSTPATCVINCALKNPTPAGYNITGTTEEGDARAVACAAGYDGTPTHSPLTCTDTGDYDSGFAGCTAKDCASDDTPTGYTNLANTKYGESATADCDAGYAGTALLAADACKVDGTWDAGKFSGCTLAGAGTTLLSMFNVVSMIAFILMMKLI